MKINTKNILFSKLFRLSTVKKHIIFLFVFFIILSINIIISPFVFRLDFSQGKAYTLSPSTKKILKSLDNTVTLKFYISSDIPTNLIPVKTEVFDLLNEYKNNSKGKIAVRILDPKKDQNAQKEAQGLGIREYQFSQLEQDKYAISTGYFSMAVFYKDKQEVLPELNDLNNFEYNVTSTIYKLTRKEEVKIGILGDEEPIIADLQNSGQTDSTSILKKILSQQFLIEPLQISSESGVKKIGKEIKTILIFDNSQKEFTDFEVSVIRDYLKNGGKGIFFTDGIIINNMTQQADSSKSKLLSLIKEYAILVNNNLVLSANAELVSFGTDTISFLSPYYFWIKTDNFSKNNPYVSNINQLTFPWVSSVELAEKSGFNNSILVKSTKNSWQQKNPFILDPQKIPEPKKTDLKEFPLIAQSIHKNGGTIIVIPSSRFVFDKFLSQTSGNLNFVLNIINNLASGGALSGIRERSFAFYPLPSFSESEKDIFKYASILLLPVLFGLFGLYRLFKRK